MKLKSVIRPLVPPVLYGALHEAKKRWFPDPEVIPPLSYLPRDTFAQAAHEAGSGYEHDALLSKFNDSPAPLNQLSDFAGAFLSSIAMVSTHAPDRRLRVLDFGGATGYFRNYVDAFFKKRIETDWTIVETPRQVAINSDLPLDSVRYSTRIDEANYDLAVFSGSLQYVDDWTQPLRNAKAEYIFIARSPLGEREQPFLQRNLIDNRLICYPGRVIAKAELFGLLAATHEQIACWPFRFHLMGMGDFDAPAMLWKRL